MQDLKVLLGLSSLPTALRLCGLLPSLPQEAQLVLFPWLLLPLQNSRFTSCSRRILVRSRISFATFSINYLLRQHADCRAQRYTVFLRDCPRKTSCCFRAATFRLGPCTHHLVDSRIRNEVFVFKTRLAHTTVWVMLPIFYKMQLKEETKRIASASSGADGSLSPHDLMMPPVGDAHSKSSS